MSTDLGKDRILNPPDSTPIMKVEWQPNIFAEEINTRVMQYVESFLKSSDVEKKFEAMKNDIALFYKIASSDLSEMENDWTEDDSHDKHVKAYDHDIDLNVSTASVVGIVLATSPLWLPILAAGIGLGVALAGVTIALSPVVLPFMKILGRDARKRKIIDEEYNNCRESIRSLICNELESNCGCVINKLLDRVTKDLLPKRMQSLQKMIQQLLKSRTEILENQESLRLLSKKVKDMEESVTELNICLIRQKGMS